MKPILLGVADTIESEFDPESYKSASTMDKYFQLLFRSVDKLCDFLGTNRSQLAPFLTDFVSIDSLSLGRSGYGHAVRDANDLGFTGVSCHMVDLGGASVGGALHQAYSIVTSNPNAVVLLAAADVPKSVFKQVSDLKRLTETVCHKDYEIDYGATLIALYALLAERQMSESGISISDYNEITHVFRNNAIDNPRAFQFKKELTPKQLSRPLAGPYSTPMIAIVTDHAFATLVTTESKKKELIDKGILKKDAKHVYIAGASHAVHAEYFYQKKSMASPAAIACEKAFSLSGLERKDVDYAWIYDCFTGMIIHQASLYFGVSPKEIATSLKSGKIRTGDKEIPINYGGGILNYQAAMSLSGVTGLIDIASQYDLAVNPIPKKCASHPRVSLLGGNGGIDSINSVVLFATEDNEKPAKAPQISRLIGVNTVDAKDGELCTLLSATTVHFNPGGDKKTPYVLCAVETERGSLLVTNLFDKYNKEILTTENFSFKGKQVKLKFINQKLQACLIE
ncbi:MAG: thiolase family protein [Leptospira sp.]|nr:thiolase family protein [Leptospira sp.]